MTPWESFKEWLTIIRAIIRADQKKMDEQKEIYRKKELAEMDLNDEWSDSRGKEGMSWHVPTDDEDEVVGI